MNISVFSVDAKNEKVQKELITYLSPHETKALFLLGNLAANFQPSSLYVAKQNQRLVGVCGFYPTFGSCSIFSENEEASRELAKKVLQEHPISALVGMKKMAHPAYEEFLKQEKKPINQPEQLFFEMELKNFKPYFSPIGKIRPLGEKDIDAAVLLLRQLHHTSKETPITEEERIKVVACPEKFCLELDGKVVSIASSNGLAIRAFQILGVSTDPSFQKKGFAKAVCSHLISHMKDLGANKAVLFTGEENIAAKKCYLSLGFQITDLYYMALFQS